MIPFLLVIFIMFMLMPAPLQRFMVWAFLVLVLWAVIAPEDWHPAPHAQPGVHQPVIR
jgi:hypothetical protein